MKQAKVMNLARAVSELVHDGDTVYLAGFTHLIPFAAGHEIIRQRKRNLTLCRATPDLIYDQMVAAGCAKKLVFSWAGNPGVGLLRSIRKALEQGELEIEEYTHYGMTARLMAGATNMPFYPLRSNLGSDLPSVNKEIKYVTCPYTGKRISVVPALNPDVSIIHVQRADRHGNAHIWGIVGEQKEAAFAASRVILTAEEIVPDEVIASDPNRTLIPGMIVDAVVEVPWCAHPSYAQGYYDRDNQFYIEYEEITKDPGGLSRWLDTWVYGVADRREYMERLPAARVLALQGRRRYSYPVDYGYYA
ncbi:MAG: CoA-transferase [Bacillota bacterium]